VDIEWFSEHKKVGGFLSFKGYFNLQPSGWTTILFLFVSKFPTSPPESYLRRSIRRPETGAAEHSLSLKVAGFGRSGGQPARSKPILNSFCLDCFLNQDKIFTIDPRSAFPVTHNVLASDEAQGAAAYVSTASSQFGPGETVSDASQFAVAVEGLFPLSNFLCSRVGTINSHVFPATSDDFKIGSLVTSTNASPTSFGKTTDSFCSSSTSSNSFRSSTKVVSSKSSLDLPHVWPASHSAIGMQSRSRSLACLHCPRSFTTQQKLE
jgi:hypothetical protein